MTHEGSIPPPNYPDPVLGNVNMWPVNHKLDGPEERVQSYLDTQTTCCLCCRNLECCGTEGCCHVGVEAAAEVKAKAARAVKRPKRPSDAQLEDAVGAMEAEGAPVEPEDEVATVVEAEAADELANAPVSESAAVDLGTDVDEPDA